MSDTATTNYIAPAISKLFLPPLAGNAEGLNAQCMEALRQVTSHAHHLATAAFGDVISNAGAGPTALQSATDHAVEVNIAEAVFKKMAEKNSLLTTKELGWALQLIEGAAPATRDAVAIIRENVGINKSTSYEIDRDIREKYRAEIVKALHDSHEIDNGHTVG